MGKPKLILQAPINPTGYGTHGANMLRALFDYSMEDGGFDLSFFPIGKISTEDSELQQIIGQVEKQTYSSSVHPCVKIWHEHDLGHFMSSNRVAFPVWEIDVLPIRSAQLLRQVDQVIVPSSWQRESLLKSWDKYFRNTLKVDPTAFPHIQVVPEGVENRPIPAPNGNPVMDFVHVGKFELRKSTRLIADAFDAAFGEFTKPPTLDMFCFNPFIPGSDTEIQNFVEKYNEHPFIRIHYNKLLGYDRVQFLFQNCKAGVWCSRAEGWNLPLLECMAAGRTVVTTKNTGMTEFLHGKEPDQYIVQDFGFEAAKDSRWFDGTAKWHRPSITSLMAQLRRAWGHINQQPGGFKPSINNYNAAMEFTWDLAARKLVDAVL